MRRLLVLLVTAAALATVAGCGGKSYEKRLETTLEQMRYRQRLDNNLMAAAKGKLETNLIFLRPPKSLEGPTKEFAMTVLEPGKFDIAESFFEQGKQNLHVLARIKRPKTAANKKGAAPEPQNRGDFIPDVITELAKAYNLPEIDPAKAKEETKQPSLNKFKHLTLGAGGKTIQVYFYGSKQTPYEVALVFDYPTAEQKNLISKIELALGSFATGEKARKAFSGNLNEEETGEAAAAGAAAF